MHHFFLSFDQKHLGKTFSITKNQNPKLYHQITKVLKLHNNEQISILNNSSQKYIYKITQINHDKKEIHLQQIKTEKEEELSTIIRLYISIPKKDKLELIIEKCSELGINEIIPIITQRTVKTQTNTERLFKISAEAVEQSHGFYIPKISETIELKNLKLNSNALNLIFHTQNNNEKPFKNILSKIISKNEINIFIGPEGGFSLNDLQILNTFNNQHFFKLGNRILKTETAAIIISALLKYHLTIN